MAVEYLWPPWLSRPSLRAQVLAFEPGPGLEAYIKNLTSCTLSGISLNPESCTMSTLAEKSSENSPTSDLDSPSQPSPPPPPKRGVRFWLAMLAIMLSTFLSALDLVSSIFLF